MWTVENAAITSWVAVALGLLLLFFGRKLFWVFVGVFGFLAGVQIAARVAQGQPELILLLIAAGLGALARFSRLCCNASLLPSRMSRSTGSAFPL